MSVYLSVEKGSKAYRLLDPDTGKMYVSRDVVFEENQTWMWEKSIKIKATPGVSFTVEGFDFDGDIYDDDGEWEPDTPDQEIGLNQVIGSSSTWANSEQSNILGHPQASPPGSPTNTSVTPVSPVTLDSSTHLSTPSTASSSTGGGAPKQYKMLIDLYENTEEINIPPEELMMIQNDEEPSSYIEASTKREWREAMNVKMASIERNNT